MRPVRLATVVASILTLTGCVAAPGPYPYYGYGPGYYGYGPG